MTIVRSPKEYRPDIDGLRAIAVLSVVFYHAFPNLLTGGFAGVDVFFVISGFLISSILFQNIDRGTFSIAHFYSRRIRRIFPALVLVLSCVLFFGWFCLFPDELQQLGSHAASSAGFIQNFTLWKESGYFDNASETKPLLHIWSLGIEEQFYFLWPLLLCLAGKLGKGHRKQKFFFLAIVSVLIVSFALNVNLIATDPTKTFYLPQYRFWELAVGGVLSWMLLYGPAPRFRRWAKDALAFLGLSLLFAVFFKFNKETPFPGTAALLPVFGTAFVIFAGPDALVNRKLLSSRFLVGLGLMSYPLYLWHWPILSFGRIIYGEMPTEKFRLLAVALSIVLSWLTVKLVEKPYRFGNQSIRLKIASLCVSVFVVGVCGILLKHTTNEMLTEDQVETERLISNAIATCRKTFPDWAINLELGTDQWCRMEKERNTIALVGDSHSAHLYYGFIHALKTTKESVANFPASGAFPALNVATYCGDKIYRKNNAKLMTQALHYIGHSPSIHTVYLAHSPDCSFSQGDAVDLEDPNEKNTGTVLRNGLRRTLKFLSSKNKNVVVVLDSPIFPFNPGKCKSRGPLFESFRDGCEVEIKSPAQDRYRKIVNEVVATQFPQVKVIDLANLFCRSGKCSPVADGKILYKNNDGGHLNSHGSVYVSQYLLRAIQR